MNSSIKKIVVVLFVIIAVASVWVVKNSRSKVAISAPGDDFALHVFEKIDLAKLKSYKVPILIDFGAGACIPCKEMAPVLVELNNELQGKAIIKFVDVWKMPELANGYPISTIPTQLFFDSNGKPYRPSKADPVSMTTYNDKQSNPVFTAHQGGMTKDQILVILKNMGLE